DEIAVACGFAGFTEATRPSIGVRNLVVLSARLEKSRKHFSAFVDALDGVESQLEQQLEGLNRSQHRRRRKTDR
ncbi:MAG: hypothetical protein ACREP1_12645, partial [Rhodanobacteraceae bacterium]